MTFIEKRNYKDGGVLVTQYEIIRYLGRYEKTGILYGGTTLACFKTKREAKEYCKAKGIATEQQ